MRHLTIIFLASTLPLLKTVLSSRREPAPSQRRILWAVIASLILLRIARIFAERLATLTACSSPTLTRSATSSQPVTPWSLVMVVSAALPTLYCQIARKQPSGLQLCHLQLRVQPLGLQLLQLLQLQLVQPDKKHLLQLQLGGSPLQPL